MNHFLNPPVFTTLVLLLSVCFSVPGATRGQGFGRFLVSLFLTLLRFYFGIFIPIIYFYLSSGLGPEWKGAANSPYSCLIVSKYVLTPFALWAWVSFYFVVVIRRPTVRPWMTLGLLTGVVGSLACDLTLLINPRNLFVRNNSLAESIRIALTLAPLVYVPVWYGLATRRAWIVAPPRIFHVCTAFVGQVWFWIWAARESRILYEALPDQPPDCYVVTASTYGYRWLVKPVLSIDSRGQVVRETAQLRRFRKFEALWAKNYPETHRIFRVIYNQLGPRTARMFLHPFAASVLYLLLKPLEGLIRLAVRDGETDRSLL